MQIFYQYSNDKALQWTKWAIEYIRKLQWRIPSWCQSKNPNVDIN